MENKEFDLKAELKSIGMTQREFAKHIKKTTSTINRWAIGEVKIPQVVKLYIKAYKKNQFCDEFVVNMQK